MNKASGKLTVLFHEPFWVGVFERVENGKLSAAKVTFGAEPKDYEVFELIRDRYGDLRFSPTVDVVINDSIKNPKRMQRVARTQTQGGVGTKSQQALKLQQEQNKQESKASRREQKAAETELEYELKRQKKKQKHRGR